MKRIPLILATGALLLSACTATVQKETTLSAPSDVTVTVYDGVANEDTVIDPVSSEAIDGITTYLFDLAPGNYHFISKGDNFFSLRKNFTIFENGKTIDANPGRKTGNGFENVSMANAYTDECAATALSTAAVSKKFKKVLSTPSFTLNKEGESYTTQQELEDYLAQIDDEKDNMYTYIIGNTTLGKNIPFVVFTATDLAGMSLEDAAAAVKANDKPIVFAHANIHGNEPSSGDGALGLIAELDGKYGKRVLPDVNVIVVPRVNGDGIEAWKRGTTAAPDLNRDNILVKNPEMKATHYAYNLFLPEIVIDMHEYGVTRNFRATEGFLDDAGITVSGNQNNTPALNTMMLEMMRGAENFTAQEGFRLWEYTQGGYSDQSPLHASHYYALRGSANFLVETPSAVCEKKSTYARRVFTQFLVAYYMIDYAIANADHLKSVVAADRASTAADGEEFNDENPIVLKHGQNEDSYSYPRTQFNYVTGEVIQDTTFTLRYYEVPLITRSRPTAYVIPKNLPDIEKILEVAYYNGISYTTLEPGTQMDLRQYKGDGKEAFLLDEKTYSFPDGAYLFPMNQPSGIILAMLMEPDFRMTDKYPISLLQANYLTMEDIYRCEKSLK